MSTINIADIRVNGGTQSRASIDRGVVSDYAEAVRDGATFPPITVFFDGSSYWLADGFHRYEAYSAAQVYDVPADIRQGTQRDAILFSVGANASHGLRRTNDDKRRAVLTLLNDPEWSSWSNREIARACGVSEYLVRDTRGICDKNADSQVRTVTRNGTTYQQNTANIGASSKAEQTVREAEASVSGPVDSPGPAEEAPASNADQETPASTKPRPARTGLTVEALEEDNDALREQVASLKAKLEKSESERKRLKALTDNLQADDKDKVIRRLCGEIEHLKSKVYRESRAADQERNKAYKLKKRVDELEAMPIDMGAAA